MSAQSSDEGAGCIILIAIICGGVAIGLSHGAAYGFGFVAITLVALIALG